MDTYINLFRFLTGYIMDFNSACNNEKSSILSSLEDAVSVARIFNTNIIVRHDLKDGAINNLLMFLTIPEENDEVNWIMLQYEADTLEYSYYSRGMKHII